MMKAIETLGLALVTAGAMACTVDETESSESAVDAQGALIKMELTSQVAVLLDEIPAGPMREAAAADALAKPASFWSDRAARQTRLTYYKLVFRGGYHKAGGGSGKT